MKRICKSLLPVILVTFILFFCCAPESYADEELIESGDYKYVFNDTGVTIRIYSGDEEGKLVIPDSIDGKEVTAIGKNAFHDKRFTNVVIPDTVLEISDSAFLGCRNLKSVSLPSNLKTISEINPFVNCTALYSFSISKDNQRFSTINGVLFDKTNKSLIAYPLGISATEYEIPNGIKAIGAYAFYGCMSLETVVIPETVERLGDYSFSRCPSLKTITLPDSVTDFGRCPFSNSPDLVNVLLQENSTRFRIENSCLIDIEKKSVLQCFGGAKLQEIAVPDGVELIAPYAFSDCDEIKAIYFPYTLTDIGDSAFWRCKTLEEIELPEGIHTIGEKSFHSCKSLQTLKIPASVEEIGADCFYGCNDLTLFVSEGSYAESYAIDNGLEYIVYAEEDLSWLN